MWIRSRTRSTQPCEDNWVATDWEVMDLIKKVNINRLDAAISQSVVEVYLTGVAP